MDDGRRTIVHEVTAGVVATAALGAAVALHLPVAVAAGAALAVYGGMRLLMPAPRPRAQQQVDALERLATSASPSIRAKVASICRSAREMFAMFQTSPRKAAMAHGFVDFTLTRTVTVLRRYQELESSGSGTAQEMLAKTETLLAMIETSFREQLDKLVREDVADLDSEIELLKTRLEVEGDPNL